MTEKRTVIASYLLLRRTIGWIGILLPAGILIGDTVFTSFPAPIDLSSYYYTPMRNILVATLCVLGGFLLLYDTGVFADRWFTNVAGLGVLGVAFCPGTPDIPHPSTAQRVVGDLHVVFASIAFVALSAAIWRFSHAGSDGPDAPAPSRAAVIFFRTSSIVMLGFVGLTGVADQLPLSVQQASLAIFDCESLAIMTFGISWLVKGRALDPVLRISAPASQGAGSAVVSGEHNGDRFGPSAVITAERPLSFGE